MTVTRDLEDGVSVVQPVKRSLAGEYLVNNARQRINVPFLTDFARIEYLLWRFVLIRRGNRCVVVICELAHIEIETTIGDASSAVFSDEDICGADVPMANILLLMKIS